MSHETIQSHIQTVFANQLGVVKKAENEESSSLRWMSIDHIVEAYCRRWSKDDSGGLLFKTGVELLDRDDDPYLHNVGLTILGNPHTCAQIAKQEDSSTIQQLKNNFLSFLMDTDLLEKMLSDEIHVYNAIRAGEGMLQLAAALEQAKHSRAFSAETLIQQLTPQFALITMMTSCIYDPDLDGTLIKNYFLNETAY